MSLSRPAGTIGVRTGSGRRTTPRWLTRLRTILRGSNR